MRSSITQRRDSRHQQQCKSNLNFKRPAKRDSAGWIILTYSLLLLLLQWSVSLRVVVIVSLFRTIIMFISFIYFSFCANSCVSPVRSGFLVRKLNISFGSHAQVSCGCHRSSWYGVCANKRVLPKVRYD